MNPLLPTAEITKADFIEIQKRGVALGIEADVHRGWEVTRAELNSGFDFVSESPDHAETRHVNVKVSLPHESENTFCAFDDLESRLIKNDPEFFLYLVTESSTDHPEVIPFAGDQLARRFYSHHFCDIYCFHDEDLHTAALTAPPRLDFGVWEIIDGTRGQPYQAMSQRGHT